MKSVELFFWERGAVTPLRFLFNPNLTYEKNLTSIITNNVPEINNNECNKYFLLYSNSKPQMIITHFLIIYCAVAASHNLLTDC